MNIPALVEEIEERVAGMPVRSAPVLRALRREFSQRLKAQPAGDAGRRLAVVANPSIKASLRASLDANTAKTNVQAGGDSRDSRFITAP